MGFFEMLRLAARTSGLVAGRYRPQELEGNVRTKYESPAEVEDYRAQTLQGLHSLETPFVARHFPKGCRVLDLGCAAGRASLALARSGHSVVAVDPGRELVPVAARLAAEGGLRISLAVMSATGIALASASFDAALMLGSVIGHIPRRAARREALEDVRRVLRPGGKLLVSTASRDADPRFRMFFGAMQALHATVKGLGMKSDWEVGDRFGVPGASDRLVYFHMYSAEELGEDLRAAGFTVIDEERSAYHLYAVGARP